jgi:signal transduction histidine kinase
MEVDLDFKGDFSKLSPEKQTSVFRILQESMENIKKHSNSKAALIRLDCTDAELSFFVEDFGTGKTRRDIKKKEIGKSHFGLDIMDERAKAVGGKVKYGFKTRGGFVVKGMIPIENSRRLR